MKASDEQASVPAAGRVLVAYFSWSGNTRNIANLIHKIVGGDIFEIVTVKPYPSDYDECVKQAGQELKQGYMPELKAEVEDIESYGTVFIGYPNWWGTIPRPVASFLSKLGSSGKTIVPFCTHGGSRLGRSVSDMSKLCPQATVLDGLAVREVDVKRAHNQVSAWLRGIGATK